MEDLELVPAILVVIVQVILQVHALLSFSLFVVVVFLELHVPVVVLFIVIAFTGVQEGRMTEA